VSFAKIKLPAALDPKELDPNDPDAILSTGTRIATNDNKLLVLDEDGRGGRYWIVPGTLEPYREAPEEWIPAIILPPAIDKEHLPAINPEDLK
jgi:hypothetical protein